VKTTIGDEVASITPTLLYKVADNVSLNADVSVDSNLGLKFTAGLSYQLSESTSGAVFLATVLKDASEDEWLRLKTTMIIFRLNY
jgi:hypothetical protein